MKTGFNLTVATLILLFADGRAFAQASTDVERPSAEITAYVGTVFDNFVAAEEQKYLNANLPQVSGSTDSRLLFGFNANWRVLGRNNSDRQLWFFLETLHGVRSADITVDCSTPDKPAICNSPSPQNASAQAHYILRNATSLEGLSGFRFEFLPLQRDSENPLSLYTKGQLGFMSVSKKPGDIVDNHFIGLGLIATGGRFIGSYFDAGYGRTDLYDRKRLDRWKYDAYLTFRIFKDKRVSWIKPFAQITVDSDFGGGADSIQSYIGFDFDVGHLFP